ncbi:MAG: chitosanase [Gammaproteobacteria bacterium]|nr:chitosanase [Gammaproteobacteria bacterium]
MSNKIKISAVAVAMCLTFIAPQLVAVENHPFPQNIDYFGINPTNQTVTEQNTAVTDFYDYWESAYLRVADTGGYYVHGASTNGSGKGTSESHGYGMLLTVLMAGYDAGAQTKFDGLFDFFNNHRSSINSELMGWFVDTSESGSGSYSSAADGDMDIAYALLLADRQWGSLGTIDYLAEATDMINNGLLVSIYNSTSHRIMLGDWDTKQNTTRSSDWMTGHLRAYENATGNSEWSNAIAEIYTMVDEINGLNNNTGLMPDFVTSDPAEADHNDDNGTGESNPGDYYYNAARTPMRLALDYIHNGSTGAKEASDTLTTWLRTKIGGSVDFNNYYSGYEIGGNVLSGANYNSSVFIAPVVVAASVDAANQDIVNAGWSYISTIQDSYFEDSINLLSMLILTGNWWAPNQVEDSSGPDSSPDSGSSGGGSIDWWMLLPGFIAYRYRIFRGRHRTAFN